MAKIDIFGTRCTLSRVGARQAAVRGYKKKAKPLVILKSVGKQPETPYVRAQRIKLMRAAIAMRGHSFEEVIANVRERATGQTKPDSVREAEKRARYSAADAHLAELERRNGTGYAGRGGYEELPGIL